MLHGACGVIENTIRVRREPEAVFTYCTDPVREPEWNPHPVTEEKLTDGPPGTGAVRMRGDVRGHAD